METLLAIRTYNRGYDIFRVSSSGQRGRHGLDRCSGAGHCWQESQDACARSHKNVSYEERIHRSESHVHLAERSCSFVLKPGEKSSRVSRKRSERKSNSMIHISNVCRTTQNQQRLQSQDEYECYIQVSFLRMRKKLERQAGDIKKSKSRTRAATKRGKKDKR